MNSNFKDNAKLRFRDEYSFHELFINILTFQFFSKKNFPQYTKRTNLCQCHGTLIKVPWSMCTFSYNIFSYIKRIQLSRASSLRIKDNNTEAQHIKTINQSKKVLSQDFQLHFDTSLMLATAIFILRSRVNIVYKNIH